MSEWNTVSVRGVGPAPKKQKELVPPPSEHPTTNPNEVVHIAEHTPQYLGNAVLEATIDQD